MKCLVPAWGGKSHCCCWPLEWLNLDLFPCAVTDDKMAAARVVSVMCACLTTTKPGYISKTRLININIQNARFNGLFEV